MHNRLRPSWLLLLVPALAAAAAAPDDANELVRLSSEDRGAMRVYYAEPARDGHFQIELRLVEARNVKSTPELPYRVALAGREREFVVAVEPADPALDSSFGLGLRALPGRSMRPGDAVPYRYRVPVLTREPARVDQAGAGPTHDTPQSRHAWDFTVPDGTPVVAARGGLVVDVRMDYTRGGLDPALDGKANVVRIEHDDGTMALYAHLAPRSATVAIGDRVEAGQRIAASGHTGFASGPHLHFAVQVNHDFALESIPFEIDTRAR
ncbi:MAG TPA: M23 family metallopeptidase [Xanthomonadales bacterium]|nr:M23 family metallopeptidase [Xanthomonadales bacterium]